MTDAGCRELLKVASDHKSAPVAQHPVLVDHRVQELGVGPLVHHLVLQWANIDRLKEHRGDPGLEQEPTSEINASDDSIPTSCNMFYKLLIAVYFLLPFCFSAQAPNVSRHQKIGFPLQFIILIFKSQKFCIVFLRINVEIKGTNCVLWMTIVCSWKV